MQPSSVPRGIARPPHDLPRLTWHNEASYVCDHCGEEIVVPVDLSAGRDQTYVEDCPVCCHPHVIHVHIDEDGELWLCGDAE